MRGKQYPCPLWLQSMQMVRYLSHATSRKQSRSRTYFCGRFRRIVELKPAFYGKQNRCYNNATHRFKLHPIFSVARAKHKFRDSVAQCLSRRVPDGLCSYTVHTWTLEWLYGNQFFKTIVSCRELWLWGVGTNCTYSSGCFRLSRGQKCRFGLGYVSGGVFRGMFRGMFCRMFRSAGLLTKVTVWGFVSGYVSKHVKYAPFHEFLAPN